MFNPSLLKGKVAIVTGGGTGLGLAIAKRMGELGADIAVGSRQSEHLEQGTADLRHAGLDPLAVQVDVRKPEQVDEMVHRVLRHFGRIDILINNAAGNFIAPTESLSARAFDAIAGIVFHGSFYVTQAVGKRWIAQAKAGHWTPVQPYRSVMSIITTWVDTGNPYVVPSAMSKAGVEVMTKSLAIEWAKYGIRLNAVGPGEIPTEGMSKRLNPGEEPGARSKERNPMARPGTFEELQNIATFLMAPGQCDWLTGQSIMMDGANALANGSGFFELRHWSDAQWKEARERIEAQNAKDRAQR